MAEKKNGHDTVDPQLALRHLLATPRAPFDWSENLKLAHEIQSI